jgi:hypothetical protein
MCVLSLQLLSETFLILRRTERDISINVDRSLCQRYSWRILTEHEFSRNILEIEFHEKSPSSIRTDGWRDGQTNMTTLTVTFRNFAKAPKT